MGKGTWIDNSIQWHIISVSVNIAVQILWCPIFFAETLTWKSLIRLFVCSFGNPLAHWLQVVISVHSHSTEFLSQTSLLFTFSFEPTATLNGLLSSDRSRAGQLTSEVVSVDDHLSLGQLSATQLSESHIRMTPSVLQCNTSNSLGGNEEAIIELDETPPKIQQESR